jgi:cell division protein FtsL
MKHNILQAFQQAPWRTQIQKIGLILTVLVIFALIAGIYLSITANSYEVGVAVQSDEIDINNMKQEIENLKTIIGEFSSTEVMAKRAKDLGYEQPDPTTFVYMLIPGYRGRQLGILKSLPPSPEKPILIRPEYKVSLWEWMFQSALALSENAGAYAK